MDQFTELLLQFLTQFAGGPGPAENNVVRFALPAILWAILLYVAWSRQRHEDLPREKWLVWGFALGLLRELFMLGRISLKIVNQSGHDALCAFVEPMEHTLGLAATVVIAASFLRYIVDDDALSRRYLRAGLGATAFVSLLTIVWWPSDMAANPAIRFHETGSAVLLHLTSLLVLAAAIVILARENGWLRNVVIIAFSFMFISEFIVLLNYATSRAYVEVLCPLGNICHIVSVVIFVFVYFREMSIEKQEAQQALSAYRDHLEHLVTVRTAELTEANKQLEKAAVLEERQRIAAEMHDGLAQTLSYLGLKTDRAGELLRQGRDREVASEFGQMQEAIGQATVDVRRSIASLRENPRPRHSLQEEMQLLCGKNSGADWPVIELHDELPGSLDLPSNEMDQVSKVVQEALLNIYQHASAGRVVVRMTAQDDKVAISIDDDGLGFDPDRQDEAASDHFGLSIMKARATRIGGDLFVHSRIGQGTEIILAWRPSVGQGSSAHDGDRPIAKSEPSTALAAQM